MDTNRNGMPKSAWIASAVLIIMAIGLFVLTSMHTSDFNVKFSENNVMIGDLMAQIAGLNTSIESIDTEEVVSDRVMDCAELGNAVAKYQTNYQSLDAATDEAGFMENVYALDACFGVDDKNSRVPWYNILSDYDITWTWEFQSTYEFTSLKVDVIWLCRDNATGDLLAYATGVYDSSLNVFTDVTCVETSIGYTYRYDSIDESGGNDTSMGTDVNGDGVIDENDVIDPDEDGSGNVVDDSGEPDGIGGGGAPHVNTSGDSTEATEEGSFGDDFVDYDDYTGGNG